MNILLILMILFTAVTAVYLADDKKEISKKKYFKAAVWFYGITFFNLFLLYVRGWGEYDFRNLSVQFLMKYMISSLLAAVLAGCLVKAGEYAGIWKDIRKKTDLLTGFLQKKFEETLKMQREHRAEKYYGKSAGICMTGACSFLLCLFAPLDLFLNNRNEFWFDLNILLWPVIVLFAVTAAAGSICMMLLFRYQKKIYQLVWMLEFILLICSYVQGNYLAGNLPPLDGTPFQWSDYASGRTQSVLLWVVVLTVVFFLVWLMPVRRFYRLAQWTAGGITAVLAVTLCIECVMSGGYRTKMDAMITTENQLEMSENSNFVILMLDAMDAGVFSKVMEDHPEYQETFADFTYYPDTMGAYPFTSRSVPFLLSGEWYENQQPFYEYAVDVYKNAKLFERLEKQDWQMDMYETEMPLADRSVYRFDNVRENDVRIKSWPAFFQSLLKLTGFKYAPFDVKQLCDIRMEEFNQNREDIEGRYESFTGNNPEFYETIQDGDMTYTERNCFKFIHLEGAHVPFRYDKDVRYIEDGTYEQNVEASVTVADAYLTKLRTDNVYDHSVIIIMSDHGYNWSEVDGRQNPFLMIKGIGETHPMQISEAPISFTDMQTAFDRLLDGKKSDQIFDWKEGDERERRYLRHVYGEEWHLEEYMQKGKAADTASMYPTGRVFDQ